MFVIRPCRATCQEETKDLHSPPAVAVEVEGDRLLARSLLPPHHPPRRPQVFRRLLLPYLPHLLHRHSPPPTDPPQVDSSPQLHADSSHASQLNPPTQQVEQIPITWDGQKGFNADNNVCTQAISDVIELMLNEPWLNYSEVPADVQKRWFEKWAGLRGPKKRINRLGSHSTTARESTTSRSCETCVAFSKAFWSLKSESSLAEGWLPAHQGFCDHSQDSSLERPPTEAEVFRETHTQKRDRSIVEKRADDLLTEFFANFEQATQQAQEEGDETAGTVDPDVVWRQTLSEPCKNRVYGAGGFFASSLHRSGYGGSFAFATCSQAGPTDAEVVDLREQVQNLTHSLQTQGEAL
ncbi:hypothetical protein PIB30_045754 [Stylosanthes scabra]|uniref:Uncharacterized protein n=1 Tax=Stylosanthes scabra TaxID=79078 RepID=A0ABU6RGT6_9FABA|nr:hypothetical protein [Stylosanthes scabra]